MDIQKLLGLVVREGGSDLHLRVDNTPMIRMSGKMRKIGSTMIGSEEAIEMMKSITPEKYQNELESEGGADYGYAFKDKARFRVSVFKEKAGIGMVCRQIPKELLSFEDIGLPSVIKDHIKKPRGLFLVTGPTGSGKTTTLSTMIDFLNTTESEHIVTIEDPIEYYHPHKKSLVTQREIGVHVKTFSEALRRALRQDPDIILVGELRDLDTISAAITAAETGHMVFATLHTTGASETITRIIDAFPPTQQEQIRTQVSTSLEGVLSQVLLPKLDGKGRVAAFELMFMTSAIGNLIRENNTVRINSSIQTSGNQGMVLLDDYLFDLFVQQMISYQDMMRVAKDPATLQRKVKEYKESQKPKKKGLF